MQDRHTFNRISIAPSIRFNLNSNTYIVAEYNLNWSKSRGADPTIPSVNGKPFVLPQNFSVADPNLPGFYNWDHMGSLKVVHKFNDNWKFNGNVAISEATWEGFDMTTRNPVDSNGLLTRQVRYTHYNGANTIGQFFFTGTEVTGPLTHKILAGADIGIQQTAYPSYERLQTDYLKINIATPTYGLIPDSLTNYPITRVGDRDEQSWQSYYIQDHITIFPFLQASLAGRISDFKQFASWNAPEEQNQRFTVFTPRFGITIIPVKSLSIYSLYDQSFLPQTGRLANGGRLKPLRGSIIEAGLKKEWFNGKLFTNIAVYDILRDNITNPDPFDPVFVTQTAQAKTTGFEVDITGKITNELSVIANYAYTNGRVIKDIDAAIVGKLPYGVAKNIVNFWMKYKFSKLDFLKNFSVSAGGTYDSGRGGGTFSSDGNYSKTTPEYLIFNAGLYYDTPFISYGLLIDNLTNQKFMTGGYWNAEWFYKAGTPTAFRFNVSVRL